MSGLARDGCGEGLMPGPAVEVFAERAAAGALEQPPVFGASEGSQVPAQEANKLRGDRDRPDGKCAVGKQPAAQHPGPAPCLVLVAGPAHGHCGEARLPRPWPDGTGTSGPSQRGGRRADGLWVPVILSPRLTWHLPVGPRKFKFGIWLRESRVLPHLLCSWPTIRLPGRAAPPSGFVFVDGLWTKRCVSPWAKCITWIRVGAALPPAWASPAETACAMPLR